ncbi:FAD-dependent monooxygenase [Tenacibaculum retecalamus]|uniref:FAD-dependent monooxygenase n=1 Tax=Tenacibaculum retecalamus TaxID=3018315 RepID=UPI0023D95334|nr:FAD-dependent monooxygenase [Tenacibaculum retecalamus]WBX71175.1 FAD-dependent monooxygenase [Tenacibaculum retecalamus]
MKGKHSKIVVLGAGIGGLTTAIALRQKGFKNISIYERREKATTIGAGLVLWSNATKILHKLELLTEIEKVGGELEQMQRWTKNEEFLGAIKVNNINTSIGFKSYSISRMDLQNILLKKVNELNVSIYYNHNALNISYQDNISSISFKNDISVNAQIIIGADGRMDSIARQYVNGNNTPIYQNFVNWIGIVESEKPIFSENNVLDFWGCGERFGIVPINKNKGYWAGGKSLPLNSSIKNKNNKTELKKLFNSWSPKIKEIIEFTEDKNIKYIEVFDHNPIMKWHKNNVCLLGDAAHASLPTSGQGACQAIEDAWHFASFLDKSETIEKAFNDFQTSRFEKTATITMAGRDLAKSLFNEDEEYCEQRNENAKETDYEIASQNIAKLWSKNLPK